MTVSDTRRSPRPEIEANRARLLDAADAVFAARGVDAGVDEIARLAGVGVGTFYRRFPTKEALLEALAARLMPSLAEHATAALSVSNGLGFEQYLVALGETLARHRGCLARAWVGDNALGPDDQFWMVVDQLLVDAKAAGRIRADVTRADVSLVYWSLRGILAAGSSVADSWRRHIAILTAGLRPSSEELPAQNGGQSGPDQHRAKPAS